MARGTGESFRMPRVGQQLSQAHHPQAHLAGGPAGASAPDRRRSQSIAAPASRAAAASPSKASRLASRNDASPGIWISQV